MTIEDVEQCVYFCSIVSAYYGTKLIITQRIKSAKFGSDVKQYNKTQVACALDIAGQAD